MTFEQFEALRVQWPEAGEDVYHVHLARLANARAKERFELVQLKSRIRDYAEAQSEQGGT